MVIYLSATVKIQDLFEYKVFIEDAASETDEPYIFENRIQDQGTLGWFFAVRLGSVYTNSPTNYDLASGVVFPK
jgi:hypothetical protein